LIIVTCHRKFRTLSISHLNVCSRMHQTCEGSARSGLANCVRVREGARGSPLSHLGSACPADAFHVPFLRHHVSSRLARRSYAASSQAGLTGGMPVACRVALRLTHPLCLGLAPPRFAAGRARQAAPVSLPPPSPCSVRGTRSDAHLAAPSTVPAPPSAQPLHALVRLVGGLVRAPQLLLGLVRGLSPRGCLSTLDGGDRADGTDGTKRDEA